MQLRTTAPKLLLALLGLALLALPAAASSQTCATKADADPVYAIHPGGHSIWLPGIGTDFVFAPDPGLFIEAGDGTARLTGTARRTSDPAHAFAVDLVFSGYSATIPPGGAHLELTANAYVSGGGPIDPATWHFYDNWSGTLTGIDAYAGAVLTVTRRGGPFQVGVGANGKNLRNGASGWLHWTLTHQPNSGSLQTSGDGDVNVDLGSCPPATQECATKADADPTYAIHPGGHAIWLPGIGTDFVFSPEAGHFVEAGDGTASLTGTVRRSSNPAQAFAVDLVFSAYSATAPPDSPHLELTASAYVADGGSIDPTTWHYFSNWSGTLMGLDDFAGATIQIARRGPAFQVGTGANGKNLGDGASGWLRWTVTHQPNAGSLQASGDGDVNIDLGSCVSTTEICVREAIGDEHLPGILSNHALSLPGISKKLIFEPLGQLIESSDGTAVLVGSMVDRNAPQKRFDVQIALSGLTTTPPPGSPVLALAPGSYVSGGGTIDPSTWVYYTSFSGTLTGHGISEGAVIAISSTSPAWQQGVGANNKNDELGAAARFTWITLQQPESGSVPATGTGNLNIDLSADCSPLGGSGHAKIGDTVWNDLDHDGVQDAGETGIENVLVRLYKDGVLVDVKSTNAAGYYSFPSIAGGNYTVTIDGLTVPAGFEATHDYDDLASLHTATVVLGTSQILLDLDFGYAAPIPPAVCVAGVAYGAHASGEAGSQLFEIVPDGTVAPLGLLCEGDAIKAMDVSPIDNRVYMIVGGDGVNTGNLYQVDKSTGAMTLLGTTAAIGSSAEITDASFHPSGVLWAFQKGVGLLTIDLASGASALEWAAGGDVWEGLAWDAQGAFLYATEGRTLHRFDPTTLTTEVACANLPGETRALDVAGDGKLVGATLNHATGELQLFEIDPASCQLRVGQVATGYTNVESLTFENCGRPAPLHGPIFSSGFEDGLSSWSAIGGSF